MTVPPRTKGIRRRSPRQAALQALTEAGGSMDYDDFRRVLARLYATENAVATGMAALRRTGMIQRRVHLTASGSVLLSKTGDAP